MADPYGHISPEEQVRILERERDRREKTGEEGQLPEMLPMPGGTPSLTRVEKADESEGQDAIGPPPSSAKVEFIDTPADEGAGGRGPTSILERVLKAIEDLPERISRALKEE